MSDPILEKIQTRLEAWAAWYTRGCLGGLGYPSCSFASLLGGRVQHSGALPLPINADAEEIEAWVCEMAQQNPQMARVLRVYYLDPASLRTQALRLQLSHTHIQRLVKKAHHWLAGRWHLEYGQME